MVKQLPLGLFAVYLLLSGCASQPIVVPQALATIDVLANATYRFQSANAQAFSDYITEGLKTLNPASEAAYDIGAVYTRFAALPRDTISYSDLLELKFTMQHWRIFVREYFLKRIARAETAVQASSMLDKLEALHVYIDEEALASVGSSLTAIRSADPKDTDALAKSYLDLVLADGDPEITDRLVVQLSLGKYRPEGVGFDGPRKKVVIPPSRASEWSFDNWSTFPEFSDYQRLDGKVFFRNISLEPGDVFLVTLNDRTDYLFTSVTAEDNYTNHSAVYVEIEKNGRIFPAVYEIHENGVRLVPLSIYFSPYFTSCVEVLRYKNRPAGWDKLLSDTALRINAEPHGFNLYANDDMSQNNRYLSCATTVRYLLSETGQACPSTESALDVNAQKNLAVLGVRAERFLTPNDFLHFNAVRFIACIDNGLYLKNAAIECLRTRFHRYLVNYPVTPGGLFYGAAKTLIGLNNKKIFILSPFLRTSFGFTRDNQPSGPAAMMAFYLQIDETLTGAYEKFFPAASPELAEYPSRPEFSIHALSANPKMLFLAERALEDIRQFFKIPEGNQPEN